MALLLGRNEFTMKHVWLKLIPLLLIFSFGIIILNLHYLSKSPVISYPEKAKIFEILYICSPSGDSVSIGDYNGSAIIDYMCHSYGRRMFSTSSTFHAGDYVLIITIQDGNKIKQLHLGNNNSYISEGVGKAKVRLYDEEKMLTDLLNILNIES